MNMMKPICNVCGSEKNVNETGWSRCFGMFDDSPTPLISPVLLNGQSPGVAAPVNLDICPACLAGITVGQLKTITASLKGAPPLVNSAQVKQILDLTKVPKPAVAAPAQAAPTAQAPPAQAPVDPQKTAGS